VLVFVCQKGNDLQEAQLYASDVEFGGNDQTVSLGQGALDADLEAAICGIGEGAILNNVERGNYSAAITIGQNPKI
jgi:hypothetical protein